MKNTAVEQDISELKRVRIEKLDNLVKEGRDPFEITKFERTHSSKDIGEGYTTEEREFESRGEIKKVTAKITIAYDDISRIDAISIKITKVTAKKIP
jgi:lysyl-tRNA synthetase class II